MDKYIIKHIDKLDFNKKLFIARLIYLRDIELKQSNNGVYCFIKNIDEKTKKEIYDIIKSYLN